MFRILKPEKNYFKKFLMKKYRLYKHEDIGFVAATLSRMRNKLENYIEEKNYNYFPSDDEIQEKYDQIYDELNILDIEEHWAIAKGDSLEQIFNIFNALLKNSRNQELVINKRYEELSKITDLIDPNQFPIFSLIDKPENDDLVSLWDYKQELKEKVGKEIGYSLYTRQSNIEHQDSGEGVFLKCYNEKTFVLPGTLLGFVPGVIFSMYDQFPEKTENEKEITFFKRYDNTVIDFSEKIPYPFVFGHGLVEYNNLIKHRNLKKKSNDTLISVPGEFLNPYALGHKINHPPTKTSPNVYMIDLIIPNNFFTIDYLRFLPNTKFSTEKIDYMKLKEYFHNDCFHCLGVFALKPISDGEELYVDYLNCNLFQYEHPPDWLIKPPPISPFLTKYEYENKFGFLAKIIDNYLLKSDFQKYYEFDQKISYDKKPENDNFIKTQIEKFKLKNIE